METIVHHGLSKFLYNMHFLENLVLSGESLGEV